MKNLVLLCLFTVSLLFSPMAHSANGIASLDASGKVVASGVTANRVLISDGSGAMAASSVTDTILSYLDIGSSLTTLLSGKQSSIAEAQGQLLYGGVGGAGVASSDKFKYTGGGAAQGFTLMNQSPLYFSEGTGGGSNVIGIKAPATLASSFELTLPADDGTSGQVLSTDGNGVTSWIAAPSPAITNTHIVYGTGSGIAGSANFTFDGSSLVSLMNSTSMRLWDVGNAGFVAFGVPATVSSNYTFTLPGSAGTAGYVLSTNGSGTTSWVANPAPVARITGDATLVAGTVTVSDAGVTAGSRIFLTPQNCGGTCGAVYISSRSAGVSFTITSSNALDTSLISYERVEP